MVCGTGIDVVEIARFERLWQQHGTKRLARLFTPAELAYALGRARPAASLAARFAAKEAVMKALGLGLGRCRWLDIEIWREEGARPQVHLSGAAAARAAELGVNCWHVSLAHSRTYAVACAVAERR